MVVAQLLDRTVIAKFACFKDNPVVAIERLNAGLSQECYRVQTTKDEFLAKRFKSVASYEKELAITKQKVLTQVIPQLNAYRENWLISEYLQGSMLSEVEMSFEDKLRVVLPLAKKFYSIASNIETSSPLFKDICLPDLIKDMASALGNDVNREQLINDVLQAYQSDSDKSGYEPVLCHGDLNFNNIMYHHSLDDWRLFDFESCHYSTVEYDLAMLLAVNEYPITKFDSLLNIFIKHFPKVSLGLVTRNYLMCLLINALWYESESIKGRDRTVRNKYKALSDKQQSLLNQALYR